MYMFRTLAKMPFLSQLRLSPSTEETDDQGGAAGGDYDDRWWFDSDHDFVIFMMTIFTNKGACDPCWLVAYIFEQKPITLHIFKNFPELNCFWPLYNKSQATEES